MKQKLRLNCFKRVSKEDNLAVDIKQQENTLTRMKPANMVKHKP